MIKSNINITSNIYIRKPESITDGVDSPHLDPSFINQITGYKALKILKEHYDGTLSTIRLNSMQEEEYRQSVSCSYVKNGEIPYGPVKKNGIISYECRCEEKDCIYRNTCNPVDINRNYIRETKYSDADKTAKLVWLGINLDDEIFNISSEEDVSYDIFEENDIVDIKESYEENKEFEILHSANDVISRITESDIRSRILVNAGPGAGKTYTAVKRLLYVLNNIEPDECDRVLVLCYTKAAVSEIKNRIEQGIIDETIPFEASEVSICTFDSFATNYLISAAEIPSEELCSLDYNQRIKLFNEKIDREFFEDFRYCIIDELQDLVNDRAKMTINILNALDCGILLLGDKCQAIYDYDCSSQTSINSAMFYKSLDEELGFTLKKYEISGNKRQTEELENQTLSLRQKLLTGDISEITRTFENHLCNMDISEQYAENFTEYSDNGTTAVLCRDNGEAEYMSELLHKNKIKHRFIRSTGYNYSLRRCIGDALWDYGKDIISDEELMNRFCVRSNMSEYDSSVIYKEISELLYGEYNDYIECNKLAKALCQTVDLPEEIVNANDSRLVVSTIHKSKGREFDNVFLLDRKYNSDASEKRNAEEERVIYVGLTRAKKDVRILKKKTESNWYFKKNHNNRWIRTKRIPYKKNLYCAAYATGLPEDIDYSSFVSGNLESAVKNQAYISGMINAGDSIELRLNGNIYDIVHNGVVVGKMSDRYSRNLMEKFNDGKTYVYQLPLRITELFVENVITFVSYREYDNIPQKFRKNRFWLALEITGFGKTRWTEND